MVSLRLWLFFVLCAACFACGGGSRSTSETPDAPSSAGSEASEVSSDADAELTALPSPSEPDTQPEPRQGDVIQAGAIARVQLRAVLDAGIPGFLQRVRTEPHKDGSRFVGWRLLSIFDDSAFALGPIRIGDVVLGVNGRTIERPEQFFAVWEALGAASEITFQVLRAGQAYEVRYAIAD